MLKEIYVCDGCGEQRREANHWFSIVIGDPATEDIGTFAAWPWPEGSWSGGAAHYCGQECAGKAFQKWMNEQVNAEVKP